MIQISDEELIAILSAHFNLAGEYIVLDTDNPSATHCWKYKYRCVYADDTTGEIYELAVTNLNNDETELSITCANSGMRNQKDVYSYLSKEWRYGGKPIIEEVLRLIADQHPI